MIDFNDTIAAIATPPGRGGIAVVRVSGPAALQVANLLTKPHAVAALALAESSGVSRGEAAAGAVVATTAAADTAAWRPRYAYFKQFYDGAEVIDEGLLIYFAAPHSYTGEDTLELQGHGGNIVPQRVLSAVLKVPGVRQAEPGEFTRRAFLNGKMDLTAAEAVEDLISAGSNSAAKAALSSLHGAFAERLQKLTTGLTDFRVHLEACLDFPEEHEDFYDAGSAASQLQALLDLVGTAETIASQGVRLNEGARIVLAGQPNAGKSSLLNALAGDERAIVTNIPGTTRDVLTINIEVGGIPVTITDTAGIRDKPSDEIEALGIARALKELKRADLILLMIDSSSSPDEAKEALAHLQEVFDNPHNLLVITSKTDLTADNATLALLKQAPWCNYPHIATSTKTPDGLDDLRKALQEALGIIPSEGVFSARRRHLTALAETKAALERAQQQLGEGDLVLTARELTLAQNQLGTITGKVTSDDLLGRIFATFCIGK